MMHIRRIDRYILDILLGNYDIIIDVLARENIDRFYSMIADFLHIEQRSAIISVFT